MNYRSPNRTPSFELIRDTILKRLGVSLHRFEANTRMPGEVLARGVVAYLARAMTPLSYPEIGHRMGRNHTSVITARDRCREAIHDGRGDDFSRRFGCEQPWGDTLAALEMEIREKAQPPKQEAA